MLVLNDHRLRAPAIGGMERCAVFFAGPGYLYVSQGSQKNDDSCYLVITPAISTPKYQIYHEFDWSSRVTNCCTIDRRDYGAREACARGAGAGAGERVTNEKRLVLSYTLDLYLSLYGSHLTLY